jgi:hypothetical protein
MYFVRGAIHPQGPLSRAPDPIGAFPHPRRAKSWSLAGEVGSVGCGGMAGCWFCDWMTVARC